MFLKYLLCHLCRRALDRFGFDGQQRSAPRQDPGSNKVHHPRHGGGREHSRRRPSLSPMRDRHHAMHVAERASPGRSMERNIEEKVSIEMTADCRCLSSDGISLV